MKGGLCPAATTVGTKGRGDKHSLPALFLLSNFQLLNTQRYEDGPRTISLTNKYYGDSPRNLANLFYSGANFFNDRFVEYRW